MVEGVCACVYVRMCERDHLNEHPRMVAFLQDVVVVRFHPARGVGSWHLKPCTLVRVATFMGWLRIHLAPLCTRMQ